MLFPSKLKCQYFEFFIVPLLLALSLSDFLQQEDIRNYIDNSLKHGVQLSAFRKERTGGDSHGIFYW